jgi:hypothetical protein
MEIISRMINGRGALLPAPLNVFGFYLTGVGSRGFVEGVKSLLGVLAKGRKSKETGGSYQLREPSMPYGAHFGVKNDDIGPENTYYWNVHVK